MRLGSIYPGKETQQDLKAAVEQLTNTQVSDAFDESVEVSARLQEACFKLLPILISVGVALYSVAKTHAENRGDVATVSLLVAVCTTALGGAFLAFAIARTHAAPLLVAGNLDAQKTTLRDATLENQRTRLFLHGVCWATLIAAATVGIAAIDVLN